MQVFKQFHKILLDIYNDMLPTIYTVKSLEPVLNCTECSGMTVTSTAPVSMQNFTDWPFIDHPWVLPNSAKERVGTLL